MNKKQVYSFSKRVVQWGLV